MRRVLSVTASVVLTAGLATAAVPAAASPGSATDRVPTPEIEWGACADGVDPAFECASVEVPTDHDRPGGATTTVALTRLPASGPGDSLGSVVYNFGGPGGPGVASLQGMADQVATPAVRERYDLVSFDPRGVGLSDPATCFRTPEEEAAALGEQVAFPVGRAETRDFVRQTRDLARSCRANARDRIAHSSTANVARDMELLRRALGDDELSYVGYSYGTYLGATYARLFPDRVGRFVLDGTIDPDSYSGRDRDPRSIGARLGQGPAAAETFGQFLDRCAEAGERCSLTTLGDPREVVERLWADLRDEPVQLELGGETVTLTYADVVAESYFAMYDHRAWAQHADLLTLLAGGRAPEGSLRTAAGAPGDERVDYASVGGSIASLCVDAPRGPASPEYPGLVAAEQARAGGFGAFRAWVGLQCNDLRVRDRDVFRGPWDQTTTAPVMVVGTRFDPATPYTNTRPYAERFAEGRTVTVEGFGHTALGRSACVDDLVTRYLLEDEPPRDGTTCTQDVEPFVAGPSTRGTAPDVPEPPAWRQAPGLR